MLRPQLQWRVARQGGVRRQARRHSAPATVHETSCDACARVTKVGAAANVGLCGLKAAAGYASGSTAMVADAFHSLGDLVSDGVTLAAIRYSRDEPDEQFPFGKGKLESLGALAVSGLLVGTAAGVGSMAYSSFTAGAAVLTGPAPLVCGVVAVAVKEALYRVTVKAGLEAKSQVTVANAHHHRSDAYSSVVAVVGIAGSMAGFPLLDPLAGSVVAAMILKTGAEIGYEALCDLLDKGTAAEPEVIAAIHKACARHHVRLDDDSLRVRPMGPYVSLYMTIRCKSTLSVSVASQVTETVRQEIMDECEQVQRCFIKVMPQSLAISSELPGHAELQRRVLAVIEEKCPLIHTVTHFTPHYLADAVSVNLEVTMDPEQVRTVAEAATVARKTERVVKELVPQLRHVDIHLELRGLAKTCALFGAAPDRDFATVRRNSRAAVAASA